MQLIMQLKSSGPDGAVVEELTMDVDVRGRRREGGLRGIRKCQPPLYSWDSCVLRKHGLD